MTRGNTLQTFIAVNVDDPCKQLRQGSLAYTQTPTHSDTHTFIHTYIHTDTHQFLSDTVVTRTASSNHVTSDMQLPSKHGPGGHQ